MQTTLLSPIFVRNSYCKYAPSYSQDELEDIQILRPANQIFGIRIAWLLTLSLRFNLNLPIINITGPQSQNQSVAPMIYTSQLANNPWQVQGFIKYRMFFSKILKFSGLWPFSVFPQCQCVYTYQVGRTPALQQDWQSSDKSHNFKEKSTISNENPVVLTNDRKQGAGGKKASFYPQIST